MPASKTCACATPRWNQIGIIADGEHRDVIDRQRSSNVDAGVIEIGQAVFQIAGGVEGQRIVGRAAGE
jgi:hypothetical protein